MKPNKPEDLFRAEKERAMTDRNSQHARLLAEAKAAFDKLMAEGQAARKSGRPRKHPLPPLKTSSSRVPPRPSAPSPPPAAAPAPAAKVEPAKPTAKVARAATKTAKGGRTGRAKPPKPAVKRSGGRKSSASGKAKPRGKGKSSKKR